jgi:ABC-type multidrug transport system permease subunit
VIKHKSFGYHHPAAYALSILAAELPIVIFQCTILTVVLYWMVGLKATAAAFFTFWITLIAITFVSLIQLVWCIEGQVSRKDNGTHKERF